MSVQRRRAGSMSRETRLTTTACPRVFSSGSRQGSVTLPHFHETNQFQVFVEGHGSMGKHAAQPLTVQYANGHTPYGPITAGASGVRYFTLRQRWDPGAKYMPGARDKLTKGNQRTRIKAGIAVTEAERRNRLNAPEVETIFEPEADGMAAWIYRFGSGQSVVPTAAVATGGQYLVVADGELELNGQAYEKWSTAFVTQDEKPPLLRSGPDGLDLLVLQFPEQPGPVLESTR